MAMKPAPDEGPEAIVDDSRAPEVVHNRTDQKFGPSPYYQQDSNSWIAPPQTASPNNGKILRVRKETFWLLVALIIALAAAIAAGVTASQVACPSPPPSADPATLSPSATTTQFRPQNVSIATVTVTTCTTSSTSTPTSDCAPNSGQNWASTLTQLSYTRVCGAWLDPNVQPYKVLITSGAPTLDLCIGTCDSYNYWNEATNMTVAWWNYSGLFDQAEGACWCYTTSDKTMVSKLDGGGGDLALLLGTADSPIPT